MPTIRVPLPTITVSVLPELRARKISHDDAVAKAETELAKFREAQDALPQPVDRHFEQALGELEKLEGESKALSEPAPDKPK